MFKKLCLAVIVGVASLAASAAEVNSASAAELREVRGIGKSLSASIVKERKAHGEFKDWDDLIKRMSGFGPSTAQKASDSGLLVRGNTYTPRGDGKSQSAPAKTASGTAPAVAPADVKNKEQASTQVAPPAIGAQAPARKP